MRILSVAAVLVAMVAVAGCGGMTNGQYCDDTGATFCNRVIACGLSSSFDGCFQAFKGGCCANAGTCEKDVASSDGDALKACLPAIEVEACSDVRSGVVPAACLMSSR